MKRGIQVALLFFVLFGLANCKKTNNDIFYNKKYIDEIKQARKETIYFLSANFVPGASVAIVKNGELIYSEGFGTASKDLNVTATRETKFRIGDLSEIFTNVIYQKLVEKGTIHPDSTIQYYFPDFPKMEHKITLQNLAQHTSGIREPNDKETSASAINISLKKGIEAIKNETLLTSPPGSIQLPSVFNYNLLGAVMEKATNKKFRNLLKEYVTDTLHLNNTVVDDPFRTIEGRSNFYARNYIAQVTNASFMDLRHYQPSVGLLSSAEDLAKLGSVLLNTNYLSASTKEKMWEPISLQNGIPTENVNTWMILKDPQNNTIYAKMGSVAGGSSIIVMYPDQNFIIAYASNLTSAMKNAPIFKIASYFLPQAKDNSKNENANK